LQETQRQLEETRKQLEEAAQHSEEAEKHLAELRRAPELSQPQLNAPILDLPPGSSVRGGATGNVAVLRVPAQANLFTVILNVAGQLSYANYAIEFLDEHGRLVWRGQGLHKSPENTFTLALPRALFPAARYRIKLYGLRDKQKELVEDYAVRIQYQ
jgi:hypothetical protein